MAGHDGGTWPPQPSPQPGPAFPPWAPPGYQQPPPGYQQPPPGYQEPPPGYGWGPPPLPKAGDERTGPLPLHPMSVSDILDGAFKLFKANQATILTVGAVFIVPLQLFSAYLSRNFLGGRSFLTAFNNPQSLDSTSNNSSNVAASLVATGMALVVAPLLAGAISRVVAASYLGQRETAGQALLSMARRSWALLIAFVVVHLFEIPAFLLCVFPGICLMTLFVSVAPAIVVERLGPVRGIMRSWRLNSAHFWGVMGVALLAGLLATVLQSVLAIPFQIAGALIGYGKGWVLVGLGAIVARLVTDPFVAIVATLIYFDGRIRKEGFDLQMIAASLTRGDSGHQ